MYRFIQRHGKKLLALFTACLMISIALPTAYQYGGSGQNPVIGRLGDEKVRAVEAHNAAQAWDLLGRLRDPQQGRPLTAALGGTAFQQINDHPVLFLLLQKEAQGMGVSVHDDEVQTMIGGAPWLKTTNPDQNLAIERALSQLLLVGKGFRRATSAIKVSEPMVRHELADTGQTINLGAVDFTTAKYRDKVPAPTADALKRQFETYADTLRGNVTEANPFGFGYKYPDRVKLQYIAIPRADVRKAVEATRDAYAWEVEAQKYYIRNQKEFPTTAPAPPPGSSAFSMESRPTTRPFTEVRDSIKNRLIDEETARKVQQVQDRITGALAGDWMAFHNAAGSATRPATAPSTPFGVPYDSFDYLKRLAEQVQKQTGVLPTVVNVADNYQSLEDLNKLPGISQAVFGQTVQPITMPVYLTMFTAPFMAKENQNEGGVLQVLEPTRPMTDNNDTVYVARVTDAQKAHRPAALTEVEKQLRDDLVAQQAYEMAKADAQKLLDQARRSGLESAAGGQGIIKIGPLTHRPNQLIAQLALSGTVADRFTEQAFKLLSAPPVNTSTTAPAASIAAGSATAPMTGATAPMTGATTAPTTGTVASTTHPSGADDIARERRLGLIELPQTGRVLVAQLSDVQAMWTDRSLPMEQAQLVMMLRNELDSRFSRDWFAWDAVVARLGYKEEGEGRTGAAPAAPPPARPPMF